MKIGRKKIESKIPACVAPKSAMSSTEASFLRVRQYLVETSYCQFLLLFGVSGLDANLVLSTRIGNDGLGVVRRAWPEKTPNPERKV